MKTVFGVVVMVAIFVAVGIAIPYTVQFKLNMLGANMVTLRDIVGLWAGGLFLGAAGGLAAFIKISY